MICIPRSLALYGSDGVIEMFKVTPGIQWGNWHNKLTIIESEEMASIFEWHSYINAPQPSSPNSAHTMKISLFTNSLKQ